MVTPMPTVASLWAVQPARFPLIREACNSSSALASAVSPFRDHEEELLSATGRFRKDAWVDDGEAESSARAPRVLVVEDEVRLAAIVAKHLSDLNLAVRVEHHGAAGLEVALLVTLPIANPMPV